MLYCNCEVVLERTTRQSAETRRGGHPSRARRLWRHRARQAEERLRLGDSWEDNNPVFPNALGRLYDANHWRSDWYYPLLKRAGLPRIRPHDLRHTAALAHGVPVKVVSEMLGHAKVGITLSIYGHILPPTCCSKRRI